MPLHCPHCQRGATWIQNDDGTLLGRVEECPGVTCPDCAAKDKALADAITWAVEWTAKQLTTPVSWPLAWEMGFPSLKAQALLDFAAREGTR